MAIILLFVAINARWIWVYRHGSVLDIDEAGYLSLAMVDYYGLHFGGISGWVSAIEMPSIQAPMTMALSSLLYYVAGPHVILGFAVPLAAGAAVVAGTYALGRSLGSSRVGLLAAVMVASCPVVVNYSRSYQFAMLATLFTTVALVTMLRSRGFRSFGWTVAFGVSLGLLPLARTMTIAFLPGLFAAAFVLAVATPGHRMRRLLMLGFAVLVGVLVAATWFWTNGMLVAHYLFNFGYGAHAVEYGQQSSKLGVDAWLLMAQAFNRDVYFPHFLVMLLGALALLAVTFWEIGRYGFGPMTRRILRTPVVPVAVFVAEVILVLTTSSNKGSGFFAPVVPPLMVLTAWVFRRLGNSGKGRVAVSVVVAGVATVAATPLLDLGAPFALEWVADLPILGVVTVTDGRGTMQRNEARAGYGARNAVKPIDNSTGRAWVELSDWTATMITQEVGQHVSMAFAFRNELYNVNTVNLQQLVRRGSAFPMMMVDPTSTGESVEGYLGWLRGEARDACVLLTSDRLGGDFYPVINRAFMEEAARKAEFVPVRHWPAPDGQNIQMWQHQTALPNCPLAR